MPSHPIEQVRRTARLLQLRAELLDSITDSDQTGTLSQIDRERLGAELLALHESLAGSELSPIDRVRAGARALTIRGQLGALAPVIERVPAITLTGNEFGEFSNTPEGKKELRAAAKAYLEGMRGQMVNCPVLGGQVEIRQRGIKETLAFSGNPKKLKLLHAVPQIIATATAAEREDNHKKEKKPFVEAYFYLKSAVTLEGEQIALHVVIEQDDKGRLYYDLLVDPPKEKAMLDSCEVSPDHYSGLPQEPSIASESKRSPDYYSGHLLDSSLEHDGQGVTLDSMGGLVLNLFIGSQSSAMLDSLSPLEQARSAAKLLQLREQLQSGALNPIEQVRVTAEALALYTALGGAVLDAPQSLDAEQAAVDAADDGLSDDPNADNYRYKDTGYIAGSRKEQAAEQIRDARAAGTMVRASDIDFTAIEANPREAKKLITKSNLFGVVDWAALKDGGMEPAAGFLLDRAYASVGKEPGENTPEARQSFVLGLETLRTRMESCKTSKDVLAVMDEIRDELMGAKLNADEADQYKTLGQQSNELAVKSEAIRDEQNVFYNAMNLASSTARTAKYDIEKRLSRGWKLTDEHEQAVRDAEAESRKATEAWRANLEQNREALDDMDNQRRDLNKQQREIVDIAKVRNLKSPESQAWLSLGERFIKAAMFRSRAGSSTFRDHAANALAGDPKSWEWAEKDVPTTEKKVTQKRRTFALKVIDVFERKGGRTVPINSTKDLENLCGFRAVQTGNWVQKDIDSAKWHVEQAAGAMLDMADILGISEKALGFGGRLGIAFGARGTGNAGGATARGTYEPIHRVINITKMNGGGAFGHENWHALDNILHSVLRGEEGGAEEFASANPKLMPEGPIRAAFTALHKAFTEGNHRLPELVKFTDKHRAKARHNIDSPHNEISRKIKAAGSAEAAVLAVDSHFGGMDSERLQKLKKQWRTLAAAYYAPEGTTDIQLNTGRGVSQFMAEAKVLDGAKDKEYWSSPDELSARAFQSYLEDRLAEKGRQNDYLSSLADNKHHYFPALGEPFKPYPEGEERTRINAAFDQVFKALRDEKAFEKALENTALLDSIFGVHDD